MSSSSTWRRPLVSTISASRRSCFAWSSAHSAMSTGSRDVPCSYTVAPAWAPTFTSWSTAAGRYTSQAATPTSIPCSSLRCRASLPRGGGLARALEAGHQDHRGSRLGEGQLAPGPAHERGELVGHHLHHLLPRVEGVEHVLAQRALLHIGGELLHHLEVHVGLEQRQAHLAHGLGHVVLGELAPGTDVAEGLLKPVGERVEHARLRLHAGSRVVGQEAATAASTSSSSFIHTTPPLAETGTSGPRARRRSPARAPASVIGDEQHVVTALEDPVDLGIPLPQLAQVVEEAGEPAWPS